MIWISWPGLSECLPPHSLYPEFLDEVVLWAVSEATCFPLFSTPTVNNPSEDYFGLI